MVAFSCTTIAVTKGASVDGSVMVTHTADCGHCDFRLVKVPAMDYEPGSQRAIYPFMLDYPRYVGVSRGEDYDTAGYEALEPLGYIDQVAHTYAYMDGVYGVINEHQLAIGECTTASRIYVTPEAGVRVFDIAALSRVAMERCTTAREAVQLMGELGVKYGYYDWGETFTVADTEEVWVFEMAPDPSKTSAIWAAKKVPDGEVFVEANCMRIRDIDPEDSDTMYSPNLHQVGTDNGFWDPNSGELLDWMKVASPGEYSHPYYSLRRVWTVLSHVAPSLELSPYVEDAYTRDYPFSVVPDEKLSVQDVFQLQRNYYQDTEFDLTEGLAAGAYGSPDRFSGGNKLVKGSWERPVSIFRCDYTFVAQLRGNMPDPIGGLLWFGPDAPHTTAYVPMYSGITDIPSEYDTGNRHEFDPTVAWWVHSFAGNWANVKFSYVIEDIKAMQKKTEDKLILMQPAIEEAAIALYNQDPALAIEFLTDYCADTAQRVVTDWWNFDQSLIVKYNDGYVAGESVGYPAKWLKEVGYEEGPTTYTK
jgi:dipeptidase